MSEAAQANQAEQKAREEEAKGSPMEDGSHVDEDEEGEEEEDEGEENFINNHDLIGVKGIIAAQKNEIEQKKVSLVTVQQRCRC